MKEIKILPQKKFIFLDISEIIRYRDLFYILAWRDLKVRYKQTFLGGAWVIFQPLTNTLIFTVFFGNLAKIPSGNLPYSLFVLCGLIFWQFFASSVNASSESMIANENIIKKVYFPKVILPLSTIVTNFVDFLINLVILFIFALFLGYIPSINALLFIPLNIVVTIVSAAGVGLFLSALNVRFRDIRYILPFFIQFLFYLTPVIYPLTIVSARNRFLLALNPMSSVVESTRSIFSTGYSFDVQLGLISVFSALLLFLFGIWYFAKTEKYFADIV